MQSSVFSPYEELKLQWKSDHSGFELLCPWVQISVDVEPDERPKIIELTKDGLGSSFLEFFAQYPISYLRHSSVEALPQRESHAKEAKELPPYSLIRTLANTEKSDLPEVNSSWKWDLSPVLAFSAIPDTKLYDPLAVYSYLRRLRLLDEASDPTNVGIYPELEALRVKDEAVFFHLVQLMLRQNYHVTHSCESSLKPALAIKGFKGVIEAFLTEEHGHDQLVLKSLRAAGALNPENYPLFSEIDYSMRILGHCAAHAPLAFCSIVGAFEGNDSADHDPLALILEKSSRPRAARGIQQHHLINRDNHHSRVGEDLVRGLAPASKSEVILAARWAELIVELGRHYTTHLGLLVKEVGRSLK